jgi:hypothetical protein
LTIQIARITVNLPLKVEEALAADYKQRQEKHAREQSKGQEAPLKTSLIPQKICSVIRGIVVVLERMENRLK